MIVWRHAPLAEIQALFDAPPGTRSNTLVDGYYMYTARHGSLVHRVYLYGIHASEPGFECDSRVLTLPPRHVRTGPVVVGAADTVVTCLMCSVYEPLGIRT